MVVRRTQFRTKKSVFVAIKQMDLLRDKATPLKVIDLYLAEVAPHDVDILRLKANVLDIQLKYSQSLRIYKKLIRINPTDVLALIDMGDLYAHRDQYVCAIRHYDRALRALTHGHHSSRMYSYIGKEEEWHEAYKGKANALLELNRTLDALKCLIQGLQKLPTDTVLGSLLQKAQAQHEKTQIAKRTTARRAQALTRPSAGRPAGLRR